MPLLGNVFDMLSRDRRDLPTAGRDFGLLCQAAKGQFLNAAESRFRL